MVDPQNNSFAHHVGSLGRRSQTYSGRQIPASIMTGTGHAPKIGCERATLASGRIRVEPLYICAASTAHAELASVWKLINHCDEREDKGGARCQRRPEAQP